MSSSLLNLAAPVANLPMPPVGFGVVTLVILMFLLLVTLAFRSVGSRHRDK